MAEVQNYVVEVDFGSGAKTRVIGQMDPPGGPYEVEILDSMQSTDGKGTLRYSVVIVEDGPAKGMGTTVFIGTDFTKEFNKDHLANLFEGMGIEPSKLKGKISLKPETVKGRHAFLRVLPAPEGEVDDQGRKKLADKSFITKAQYLQEKKALAVVGAAGSAPVTRGAPANGATGNAAPPPPAAASTDLDSMFPKN
jgi:hypothetical protein